MDKSDQELVELLTLTVNVNERGTTIYRNHLGQFHRVHGPAVIATRGQWWYRNGLLHRDHGPAVILDSGRNAWFRNGARHRSDGPAIEYTDGGECEWWLNDQTLTEVEFNERVKSV